MLVVCPACLPCGAAPIPSDCFVPGDLIVRPTPLVLNAFVGESDTASLSFYDDTSSIETTIPKGCRVESCPVVLAPEGGLDPQTNAITVTSVAVVGAARPVFTLAPSGLSEFECEFVLQVTYQPLCAGTDSAQIVVTANAHNGNNFAVDLRGNATPVFSVDGGSPPCAQPDASFAGDAGVDDGGAQHGDV